MVAVEKEEEEEEEANHGTGPLPCIRASTLGTLPLYCLPLI